MDPLHTSKNELPAVGARFLPIPHLVAYYRSGRRVAASIGS